MRNLYYEQLERECDPDLMHIHLTVDEVKLLEFSITHIPAIDGNPNTYRLANKFRAFLNGKRDLESNTPLKRSEDPGFINNGTAIEPDYVCRSCGARVLDYVECSEWVWCTDQPPQFCPGCGRPWKED